MKISVIVPAFNEEKLIAETLRAIRAAGESFLRLQWEIEIIVCDNNSTDRTAELSRAEGARVVFEPLNQIARARNSGAAAATGDWMIFVDADSHPSPGLFAAVAREIQKGDVIAGGSTIRLIGPYPVGRLVTGGWNILSRLQRWAAGSFIFCEARAFREIGGFSNELFAAEELDLSQRLKRLGSATGRRMVILHKDPLLTSARKMDLYTPWEHMRFLARTILAGGRTLKKRDQCHTWYDGRR
ncbi:MAG: hypothetical protein QOF48_851 [Verrucomicrobiota bacterium]|jgi:glycosyltransferase involved in cell wall biosynthesis